MYRRLAPVLALAGCQLDPFAAPPPVPPAVLGGMIGSALVGTFLGVLLSYGIVGPCAARLKSVLDADGEIYQVVRRVIVASLKGQPQPLVIEAARTAIAPANQPSFSEVFDGMRAK